MGFGLVFWRDWGVGGGNKVFGLRLAQRAAGAAGNKGTHLWWVIISQFHELVSVMRSVALVLTGLDYIVGLIPYVSSSWTADNYMYVMSFLGSTTGLIVDTTPPLFTVISHPN